MSAETITYKKTVVSEVEYSIKIPDNNNCFVKAKYDSVNSDIYPILGIIERESDVLMIQSERRGDSMTLSARSLTKNCGGMGLAVRDFFERYKGAELITIDDFLSLLQERGQRVGMGILINNQSQP